MDDEEFISVNKQRYYENRLKAIENLLNRAQFTEATYYEDPSEKLVKIEVFMLHIEKLCQDIRRSIQKDIE